MTDSGGRGERSMPPNFILFIYFLIELNNCYNQIRKLVKMGYKGHYNAYMKLTMVQCQFDTTVGWLLYICSNFISIVSTARLLTYIEGKSGTDTSIKQLLNLKI